VRGPDNDYNPDCETTPLIQHEPVTCPYCWQTIEIALDLSVEEQRYVEDCSVCCRPIVIGYRSDGESLLELEVAAEAGE
jgi:cysteine-rich CPXCG protein